MHGLLQASHIDKATGGLSTAVITASKCLVGLMHLEFACQNRDFFGGGGGRWMEPLHDYTK